MPEVARFVAELQPDITPLSDCTHAGITVDVLRLDQLDPHIGGNKLFKLAGHLDAFQQSSHRCLLSFGGPYSNHLHALAHAGKQYGFATVALVRGYDHVPLTPTLLDCQALGMQLVFVDKVTYRQRHEQAYQQQLSETYQAYVIPEGGGGADGMHGCRHLTRYTNGYDQVWLAVGTGTTALGVAANLSADTRLVGVNVVSDGGERMRDWQQRMPATASWALLDDYHGGGFGRCPSHLLRVIERYDKQGLLLDPVYTARLVWAFEQELEHQAEKWQGQRILLLHTGGLQGRRGYGLAVSEDGQ